MRYLLLFVFLTACGVKGKPQPPIVPPLLGKGEPNYSEITQELNLKKKKAKLKDDWEDSKDFNQEQTPEQKE